MTNYPSLLTRLESLTDPDRETFLAVAAAVFDLRSPQGLRQFSRFKELIDVEAWEQAALTLVPEGFWWEIAYGVKSTDGTGPYWAECYSTETMDPKLGVLSYGASTPAIALSIVALKARGVK